MDDNPYRSEPCDVELPPVWDRWLRVLVIVAWLLGLGVLVFLADIVHFIWSI